MEKSIIKKLSFELDEKNKPIDSLENLELLAEEYDIKFSYDLITRKELITLPDHLEERYHDPYICLRMLCRKHGLFTKYLKSAINLLCHRNSFNKVHEVLTSTIWDGRDRLEELYNSVELLDIIKEPFDRIKKYYLKTYLKQFVLINCVNDKIIPIGNKVLAKNILVLTRRSDNDPCVNFLRNLLPEELKQYFEFPYSRIAEVNASLVHLCDISENYKSIQCLIKNNKWQHSRNISYCYSTTDYSFLDSYKNYDFLFVLPVSEIHDTDIDMAQVYAQLREEIETKIRTGVAIGDILRMPEEYMEDHRDCLRYAREDSYCYFLVKDFVDLDAINDEKSEPLSAFKIYKELIKRNDIKVDDTDDMADNIAKILFEFGFTRDSNFKFKVKFK